MTWLTATEQRSSLPGDQLLEQTADPGDLFHVPDENEKARKGDQKGVIDL